MGPYLANPVLEKNESKGENAKLKMKFARCEMQGRLKVTKDGEEPWRMLLYQNLTLETQTLFLVFSMVTEVLLCQSRELGFKVC